MRKLLTILCSIVILSGYTQTTGSYWRVIKWTTPFGQDLPDSVRVQVKDSVKEYMIHHIGGVLKTHTMAYAYAQGWVCKFPKDLSGYSLTAVYEYEITTDAENNIPIPFALKPTSLVFYNSQIIGSARWSGLGTTTLNVSLDTRKNDKLIIKN